jgi:hypothetical protein
VIVAVRSPDTPHPAASRSPVPVDSPLPVTPPPSAPATVVATCTELVGALPAKLEGAPARPVSAAPNRVVAWGDPPVVLRCGVDPVTVPPDTNMQFEIGGVRWFTEERDDVVVFTTTDRTVPVEIAVPVSTAENPADVVATLAEPVGRTVPVRD